MAHLGGVEGDGGRDWRMQIDRDSLSSGPSGHDDWGLRRRSGRRRDIEFIGKLSFEVRREQINRRQRPIGRIGRRGTRHDLSEDLRSKLAIQKTMVEPISEIAEAPIARGVALVRAALSHGVQPRSDEGRRGGLDQGFAALAVPGSPILTTQMGYCSMYEQCRLTAFSRRELRFDLGLRGRTLAQSITILSFAHTPPSTSSHEEAAPL